MMKMMMIMMIFQKRCLFIIGRWFPNFDLLWHKPNSHHHKPEEEQELMFLISIYSYAVHAPHLCIDNLCLVLSNSLYARNAVNWTWGFLHAKYALHHRAMAPLPGQMPLFSCPLMLIDMRQVADPTEQVKPRSTWDPWSLMHEREEESSLISHHTALPFPTLWLWEQYI